MSDRLLVRAIALATGVFACSPVSAAYADDVTVPGCFGAATAIVCNVTVDVTSPVGVTTTDTTIPVCVGTCVDVPVTVVGVTPVGTGEICVSYTNRAGTTQTRTCRTVTAPTLPTVSEIISAVLGTATRYQLRGCDWWWETGFVLYDTQTGRNEMEFCTEVNDVLPTNCDIDQRPICQ